MRTKIFLQCYLLHHLILSKLLLCTYNFINVRWYLLVCQRFRHSTISNKHWNFLLRCTKYHTRSEKNRVWRICYSYIRISETYQTYLLKYENGISSHFQQKMYSPKLHLSKKRVILKNHTWMLYTYLVKNSSHSYKKGLDGRWRSSSGR